MFNSLELKADMHAIRYAANNNQDIYLVYGIGRKVLLDSRTAKIMLELYNNLLSTTYILHFEFLLKDNPYKLAISCWKIKNKQS